MEEKFTGESNFENLSDVTMELDSVNKINISEISQASKLNEIDSNDKKDENASSMSNAGIASEIHCKECTTTIDNGNTMTNSENQNMPLTERFEKEITTITATTNNETDTIREVEVGQAVSVTEVSELSNSDLSQSRNFKNVILEDWDFDVPNNSENSKAVETKSEVTAGYVQDDADGSNNQENDIDNQGGQNGSNNPDVTNQCEDNNKNRDSNNINDEKCEVVDNKSNYLDSDLVKPVLDKKKNPLKYSNLIVSNQDIVEILDSSVERICRPIIPAKDIFLSIELTKHLNQKLSTTAPGKKLMSDTSDTKNLGSNNESIKKTIPEYTAKPKTVAHGEDLKNFDKDKEFIRKEGDCVVDTSATPGKLSKDQNDINGQNKKGRKKPVKKNLSICDEMERTIALRQLRDEFPSTRKKSHTTKKVNHIPFLASSVLEKALTSANSPSKSPAQRRRPCYLPDTVVQEREDSKEVSDKTRKKSAKENSKTGEVPYQESNLNDVSNSSTPVVRTYSIKRKSTESESDVRSALQTFFSVPQQNQEPEDENSESKPKKQKTVVQEEAQKVSKPTPKKGKMDVNKKRNHELEKLLGDEGAVRMLYDAQHKDENSRSPVKKSRTISGLKKDLILKTKLVKNAVLRLSGTSSDGVSLRGKRRSIRHDTESVPESDSLFVTSTPNVILYKQKKKQRAEASRILYRHSSSESFESIDGFRRTSFEGERINSTNGRDGDLVNGDVFTEKSEPVEEVDDQSSKKTSPRKTRIFAGKRLKKLRKKGDRNTNKERSTRDSVDSPGAINSKFSWSNVPVRKSCRPRVVSKKYSIWASTSMDSLSVESLGLKKTKKASQELGKKLNCKELRILQHGSLVQIILSSSSTVLKNSFNEQVLTELKDAFDFLDQQEYCSAILLTSVGSTFCQGIDLNYVLSVEENDRRHSYGSLLNCLKKLIICLCNYKKPIIAGVHSIAIGLGVTLLPYCDIVVCSDTASFYTPYARLGQASEGAATVTFPRIHRNLVTELLFKCQRLSPLEAFKLGLVSQIIPEERFEDELILLAKRIASQSTQAMQSMKFLLNRIDCDKIEETLEIERQLVLDHWCSNDCINNIIKFLNSGEVQFRQLDVT